ncbi:MAG: FAD-linked oxidase C-terminal domain-containing protein [Planctomycetota bacterium]
MHPSLVPRLVEIVGRQGVIDDPTRLLTYESDSLALVHRPPEIVVLPRTTAETARALAVLAEAGVPLVPRGAGTGLSGGATPIEGGAVISTARMRDILAVDAANRFARVQAGVVNHDLDAACRPHGLRYAPDPSSQKACTLGGNVGNDAGGPHCLKYGTTSRHVRGLVIVTGEGEVLDLSAPELDPAGYDLVGLFVGSEGTFGIATEVTVNLVPIAPVVEVALALYRDLDAACDSVSNIIAARLEPSALEIVDQLTIQAVESSVLAAGYPKEVGAVLVIEAEGAEVDVAGSIAAMVEICRGRGALDVRTARDAGERLRLWAGRKGAFGAMGRVAPDLYVADAVVPRTRLRELVARAVEICAELDLRLANVLHAGDGNLHPNICYDRRDPDEVRRVVAAGHRIMQACVAAGGTLSGEHGIGVEKRDDMRMLFDPVDLEVMDRVRAAWDPGGRMNPGKVLPARVRGERPGAGA